MSKRSGALFIGFVVLAAIVVILVLNNNSTNSKQNSNNNSTNTNAVSEPIVASDGSYTVMQSTDTELIGEIITYSFGDSNSLNVMPAAMQSVVLNETPTMAEADITVAGLAGKKLTLSSAKDGSPFTVVQVVVNDQLFDFRGTELFLDTLGQYIVFNQK